MQKLGAISDKFRLRSQISLEKSKIDDNPSRTRRTKSGDLRSTSNAVSDVDSDPSKIIFFERPLEGAGL